MKYIKYLDKYIPSFEGKTVVVTGANSGIGFSLAMQLAYKHAHVVMACRNLEKANKAKEKILLEVNYASIDVLVYNQASFASIESFGDELMKKYLSIYGFVFNAGIYHPKKGLKTEDGMPLTIGTNYAGAFYLGEYLKDYFKSNSTRVVIVTSLTQIFGQCQDYEKALKNDDNSTKAYSVSKRLDISFAAHLLDEIGDSCLVVLSHPGVAKTGIIQEEHVSFSKLFIKLGNQFLTLFTNNAEKSSLTSLLALSREDVKSFDDFVPRGLFHIVGYPKKIKLAPEKYRSEPLNQITKKIISSKKRV